MRNMTGPQLEPPAAGQQGPYGSRRGQPNPAKIRPLLQLQFVLRHFDSSSLLGYRQLQGPEHALRHQPAIGCQPPIAVEMQSTETERAPAGRTLPGPGHRFRSTFEWHP